MLRSAIIEQLDTASSDLLIIGGGIHGACLARLAAKQGYRTVLLEQADYASGTSSRSSKMAHGGLRYLELGDFSQVFEGIRAREDLFENFPHLVKPYPFLIPVNTGDWFLKAKLGLGLWMYDLLVRNPTLKHKWIPRNSLRFPGFNSDRNDLAGCYQYTDGILSDTRLVLENISVARRAGATCLNYAEVTKVVNRSNAAVEVEWRDRGTDEVHQHITRTVVNCAGPWVPVLHQAESNDGDLRVRYSRGVHLLFSNSWNGPALFLPLKSKARYYFVWPHPAGTLIGTTEREVHLIENDPVPNRDEVEEILERIAVDLPGMGLNRSSLHYGFAGIRTLPVRSGSAGTDRLSRRHRWVEQGGMLNLLGGKLTTAEWTSREGLARVNKTLGAPQHIRCDEQDQTVAVEAQSIETSLPVQIVQGLTRRYGGKVSEVVAYDSDTSPLGDGYCRSEIRYALEVEQAECLEDIMRRRLEIEYLPGYGVDLLPNIIEYCKELRPHVDWTGQRDQYLERLASLRSVLGLPSDL